MEFHLGNVFELVFGSEFDGIVTDPPYNRSTASNAPDRLGCPTFDNKKFLTLATQVTKHDAFLVFTSNFPNGAEILNLAQDTPWNWIATQVWDKRPSRTWVSWSRPLKCVEYIHYYSRGDFKFDFRDGTVKEAVKRSSFGGKMKKSSPNKAKVSYGMYQEVVTFPKIPKSDKRHPTQKPVEMSSMIAQIVGSDLRVLDPFCGSGALLSAFPNSVGVDRKNWV